MRFDGLAELREAMRNLPAELTAEAGRLTEATANAMAVEIRTEYGRHHATGNLQGGVVVTHFDKGKYSAGAIVKSTAKHAWLFDNGSQARHYFSVLGKEHKTGKMWGRTPPTHVFVRAAVKARRSLQDKFRLLLERNGLTVTGTP